jgi:peroxiredoxin
MATSEGGAVATHEVPQRGCDKALTAIAIVLVVSVALNVMLAHKIRSLKYGQSARITENQLKVGAAVPPIPVMRLDGQPETIRYQGTNQATVLYIFTPPCGWCARNMDNFKTLVDKERDQYRFIGLSLSEKTLQAYVAKNDMGLPVYSGLSPETLKAYELGSTPQTVVVSPDGRVLQDWVGAYVGDQKSQVEAFFHVSLPGLRELQNENQKQVAK